nr:MAG TPA: hypothetical protein [Caudoviricetes sp.]
MSRNPHYNKKTERARQGVVATTENNYKQLKLKDYDG